MGPSGVDHSERGGAPSAMGGRVKDVSNNSSASRHARRGPFSLTTFMAKDDAETHELGSNSDQDETGQSKFSSGKRRSRVWESQGKRDNESETELTFEASKNSLGSERGDNIVVVQTFSLREDRV